MHNNSNNNGAAIKKQNVQIEALPSCLVSLFLSMHRIPFSHHSILIAIGSVAHQQYVLLYFYRIGCISMSSLPNVFKSLTNEQHIDRCMCVGVSAHKHIYSMHLLNASFPKTTFNHCYLVLVAVLFVMCIHLLSLYFSVHFYSLREKEEAEK